MKRVLKLGGRALADLDAITLHIAEQAGDRASGEVFAEKLRGHCRKLAELPGILGTARPKLRPDIRSTPYQSYVIFFRYQQDAVEIINILAAARDLDAHFDSEP